MSFKEANEKIKETAERLAYSQQVRYYSDRLQEKLNRARMEIKINSSPVYQKWRPFGRALGMQPSELVFAWLKLNL